MKFSPPTKGEICRYPCIEEFPSIVETNFNRIDSYNFSIDNIVYKNIKKGMFSFIKNSLDLGQIKRPLIGCAHQPGFFSPGIVRKFLFLYSFKNFTPLNFLMDNGYAKYLNWKIPIKKEYSYKYKHFNLVRPVVEKPLEFIQLPKKEDILNVIQENADVTSTFSNSVANNCRKLKEIIKSEYENDNNLSYFLNSICSSFTEKRFVNSILVSCICKSKGFRHYFKDIVENIETFSTCYNNILENYRVENRIKNKRAPFPNLKIRKNLYELPFWYLDLDKKIRRSIFVEKSGSSCFYKVEGKRKLINLENFDIDRVRPKAITFTIFLRIFLCDLFIHGIGGGNYEKITDDLIQRYYKIIPPLFFVVSETRDLTHVLDDTHEEASLKLRKTKEELNKMKNSPHKFLSPQNGLVKCKNALIEKIKKADKSRKPEVALKIKKVDKKLLEQLQPTMENKKERIEKFREKVKNKEILRKRDFPYFLFNYTH